MPPTDPSTVPPPTGAPTPAATIDPTIPSDGPSAQPSSAPTPAASVLLYTVQTGDTLGGIATKFHTTISALQSLNNIVDPRKLHIGQKLQIPA